MAIKREINESPIPQGESERVSYTLDTTPWGGSPDNVTVAVYDYSERIMDDDTDVTDDVMPANDPSVDDNIITLSAIENLIPGVRYRVNISWTNSGNTLSTYCYIDAEQ